MSQHRSWVFTLNNYTEDEELHIQGLHAKYVVYGREVGENGTPHLQGYIQLNSAKTLSAMKRFIGPRVHIEVCMDNEAAIDYCKKGEQPHDEWRQLGTRGEHYGLNADIFEAGVAPLSQTEKGQKSKIKWAQALEAAKRGRFEDIDPMIQITQHRNLQSIHMKSLFNQRSVEVNNRHLWFWGKTGTGKSRKARGDFPDAYIKQPTRWWDGYMKEKVCIIEDFDVFHVGMSYYLKIWADRFPFPGEIKGGNLNNIRPQLIIITSNYHPSSIWNREEDLAPIERRFDIIEFTHEFVPIVLYPPELQVDEGPIIESQPPLTPAPSLFSEGSEETQVLSSEESTSYPSSNHPSGGSQETVDLWMEDEEEEG